MERLEDRVRTPNPLHLVKQWICHLRLLYKSRLYALRLLLIKF